MIFHQWNGCKRRRGGALPACLQPAQPSQRSLCSATRKAAAVGRPPRASAGDGFRWLRGAPIPEFCPPPTRHRHRPRAPAANPARLALAAGGAGTPAAPRGSQEPKPQPSQAGKECSGWPGSFCPGYPRCARRWRGLDSARPAAGFMAAAWPENGLGQGARRAPVALPLVAAWLPAAVAARGMLGRQ